MSVVLGQITVRSNRLAIGDPNLPPRGTVIDGVPNGTFDVVAETKGVGERRRIASVRVRFADRPGEGRAEAFSIDSGVVSVSDPSGAPRASTWLGRWRERRAFWRRILRGVGDLWYVDSFAGPDGDCWAVVARVLNDDIYPLRIVSDADGVVEVQATILR